MRLPLPWSQSWNTTLYQSCAHTHTSGLFLEENPREYFTYDLQGSVTLSSKAYAGLSQTNLHSDDISMCFKYCSNVQPFHLRRDCRPVCWTNMPLLYAAVCFCWTHFRSLLLSVQEKFSNLILLMSCWGLSFNLFSWPAHPIQKQYHRTRGNLKFLSKACVYTGNQSLTPLNLYSYLNYLRFKLCT